MQQVTAELPRWQENRKWQELHLLHDGVPNIICTQPFACLPNHIVGKGVIKKLRAMNPDANIVADETVNKKVLKYLANYKKHNTNNQISTLRHHVTKSSNQ